ncbi:Protein embryonic flower 1 [Vitis vinifera]|uniref:Protein embryonic flower 1 n=1 Tax=Vitis vinifera TaxID=29760 RepID=A0A438C217_VITVI|nr:Protein embryonic flower 1 [Vitis vinifera]
MEECVLAEASHQRGDSILTSRPNRPLVKIDSISIDLISADEKNEAEKCQHFSIRGYVAEVRKRDKKICWPFALDESHNKLEEQTCILPPLDVPKFRWWHCQNCLQEIGTKASEKEIATVPSCNNTVYKSNGTCLHMTSRGAETVLLLDYPRALNVDISEGRKVDASTSGNVNDNEHHVSLCSDKQDKQAEVACSIIIGDENRSEEDADEVIPEPPCGAAKVNPCLLMEKQAGDTVALELNCNGVYEVADIGLSVGKMKYMVNSSDETCQMGKHTSMDDQNNTAWGSSKVVPAVGVVDEALNSVSVLKNDCPLLELDDSDQASSESDEILIKNSFNRQHDNSSGWRRRKSRKVRLLTDLLGAKENNSTSNAVIDASTSTDSLSVPQGEVAVQGNARRGFRGQNRKRKMFQDEDWRPPEISYQNDANKKFRTFKGDVEITDINIAIDNAESEEDGPAGIGSQTGVKTHWTRPKIDRISGPNKKKNKKTSVDDGCSSLLPPQVATGREIQDKNGDADVGKATDAVLSKSPHDAFAGKRIEAFLKNLPAQQTEGKSSLSKKKNKMPLVEEGEASLMPWKSGVISKDQITRKEVEYLQCTTQTVPFQSVQDHSAGKDLQLFLNSLAAQRKDDAKYVAPVEDGLALFLSQQENLHREDVVMRKDVERKQHIGANPALVVKVEILLVRSSGVGMEIDGRDFSGKCNKEKAIEVQELSEANRKHSDHRVNEVFEQGTSDDIPMEIVELMARNQYERRKTATGKKPQSSYGRNSMFTTAENVGSSREKSGSYFSHFSNRNHFNMAQPEGTHGSTGVIAFPVCQEKPSSGVQFSCPGPSRHNGASNCKWSRDMVGQRSSHTSLHAFEAYNACYNAPQQSEEAAHVWSAMTPNHMAFGFSIPQECATHSNNMDMISHSSNMLHKRKMTGEQDLKFLNSNAFDLEKQNRSIGSETLNRAHVEYPFACKDNGIKLHPKLVGSLDLYSNENIPAMHLLSLMDSGMQSRTPFSMDGDSKFLKKSAFPRDYDSREFSGLEIGAYKARNSSRQPSSDHCGKNHLAERSCACSLAVMSVGAFASSSQKDGNFKPAGLIDQVLPRSRGKEKSKVLPPPIQNRGCTSRKSSSTCGDYSGTNHESIPIHDTQKRFPGASNSMRFPLQPHTIENSIECIALETHCNGGTFWPINSSSGVMILLALDLFGPFRCPGMNYESLVRSLNPEYLALVGMKDLLLECIFDAYFSSCFIIHSLSRVQMSEDATPVSETTGD